jgi:uncharacterized protein (DUF2249 family)
MNINSRPVRASDKLHSLFERDERLIDVVASHSPQLAKLRHSPMRRIMARVTTVEQAARLCHMPVDTLVRDLNHSIGIEMLPGDAAQPGAVANAHSGESSQSRPRSSSTSSAMSFDSVVDLDVREELRKGGEPFSTIMSAVAALREGQVLHLRAPFEPVPLLSVLQKRGFAHESERHADDDWSVWFFREAPARRRTKSSMDDVATPQSTGDARNAAGANEADDASARIEVRLDVRNMEPPEPLLHTLEALETLPVDSVLVQVNSRVPHLLLPILRERGFHFTVAEPSTSEVQVRIWRSTW